MKKYKFVPIEKGTCYLCQNESNLDDADLCLCGCASVKNGVVEDVKAEIVWVCEACSNKNKDIKRVKVIIE